MRVRGRGRARLWTGALLAVLLLATACTVDPVSSNDSGESGAVTEGPVRIAMITHGDAGAFWSVVRRGAEDAAGKLDVVLDYQGAAGDAKLQEQMIEAALLAGAQGLAISAPDIGAIRSSLERADKEGVPVVTLNSGASLLEEEGNSVITHVGQSEFIAGEGAGEECPKRGPRTCCASCTSQTTSGCRNDATAPKTRSRRLAVTCATYRSPARPTPARPRGRSAPRSSPHRRMPC